MPTHCLKKMLVLMMRKLPQGSLWVSALLPVMKTAVPELALGPACAAPWPLQFRLKAPIVPPQSQLPLIRLALWLSCPYGGCKQLCLS